MQRQGKKPEWKPERWQQEHREGVREMGTVSKEYLKQMPDGTNCKYTFTIEAENISKNAQEILHNLAILSKSAYIHLGNKIVYGSEDQNET